VPIVLLWVPVHLCYAGAWYTTMADGAERPPFWRVAVISISSFAVNLVTPFVQAGGEVYRTSAVTPWVGPQKATSATVTYYMIHALSNMITWLLGIAVVVLVYPVPASLTIPLVIAAALIVALIAFVFARHQSGVVAPLVRLLGRIPLLRRLVVKLEAKKDTIEELDTLITDFYHTAPGRFFLCVGLDTFGRILSCGEFWLMAKGIGLELNLLQAFVMGSFGTLIVNIIFFVPLEAGVKEGSFYFIFQMLNLDPALGVFAAIVQRLREFAWIGLGLLFTLGEHKKTV
jgi:uncharacterized membrane protein YbhN (UPF0104 family)